jgi:PhzF family phenazine biosynthesis protein
MNIPIYQVDAFASALFQGNPAAVMPLASFLPDATLLSIAAENNLSETAYLVKTGEDYRLRWFTPSIEVSLCGHATLASAAVVMERLEPERREVRFHTHSGVLTVKKAPDGYVMDFPAQEYERVDVPVGIIDALGAAPLEVWKNDRFTLVLLKDAAMVRVLKPNFPRVAGLDPHGVIVTATGDAGYDFVSRFFAPNYGINEDPVTGSAHCMLVPFWANRLGKDELRAFQASSRGGELTCTHKGARVELRGKCAFYLEGVVLLSVH